MQFLTQIRGAKSFSELQRVIAHAKSSNELKNIVLYEAIKKANSRDCKNFKLGYELTRQIPLQTLQSLDKYTLKCMLNCTSQEFDFRLAHHVFLLLKDPNSFDFHYYINSFKNAKAYELSPEMIEELGSLWKKIELSVKVENDKLLNQLFCVLSFSKEKQYSLLAYITSKPPNSSFTCGLIGNLLKFCSKINDLELAKTVWNWGKPITSRECGTFRFFQISYQYYDFFPTPVSELKNLWCQVRNYGLDSRVELVSMMCKSLSQNREEQWKFIEHIISSKPDPSFDSGLLGTFLKHCFETNNVNLARDIWRWGEPVRYNGLRESTDITIFQYLSLCGSVSEKRAFILEQISLPVPSYYHCGNIGAFLSFCSDQNNLELARKVWTWSRDFRSQCKGSSELRQITIQFISICGESGDLPLLEAVWREAKDFKVSNFSGVIGAFLNALFTNGAVDRVLEVFGEVPCNSVDEKLLTFILNALSHTGRDLNALNVLRRVQCEKPGIISVFSYTSVIDAFARNGNYDMALSLIEEMKSFGIEPDVITWMSILSPCRFYKNLPVALKAFEELRKVEHKPEDITSANLLLADVYRSCGDLNVAHQLHGNKIREGVSKAQGGVQLCLPNSQRLSFHFNEMPSTLEPDVCVRIIRALDDWIPIFEKMGQWRGLINCRHSEILTLAYSVEVLNLKRVFTKKNLRVSCCFSGHFKLC